MSRFIIRTQHNGKSFTPDERRAWGVEKRYARKLRLRAPAEPEPLSLSRDEIRILYLKKRHAEAKAKAHLKDGIGPLKDRLSAEWWNAQKSRKALEE